MHSSLPHIFQIFLCLCITFLVKDPCNPVETLKLKLNILSPFSAFPHSTYYHLAHYVFFFLFLVSRNGMGAPLGQVLSNFVNCSLFCA